MTKKPNGNTIDQPEPDYEEALRAERLKAEILKLKRETEEIEKRISMPWWKGQKFTQYMVAIIITSGLLFGWTRGYLEPLLTQESKLNQVVTKRNEEENKLLVATNKNISRDRDSLAQERIRLTAESDSLKEIRGKLEKEKITLKEEKEILQNVVGVMNDFILQKEVRRFFSIVNPDDPIKELNEKYKWEMTVTDFFTYVLGYYWKASHESVNSGNEVIIARIIEIEDLKKNSPDDWRDHLNEILEVQPIIALDYSYLGLKTDINAPIGGTIFIKDKEPFEFYAPMSKWSEKLKTVF